MPLTHKFFSCFYYCGKQYFHKTFRVPISQVPDELRDADGLDLVLERLVEFLSDGVIMAKESDIVNALRKLLETQKGKPVIMAKCIVQNEYKGG